MAFIKIAFNHKRIGASNLSAATVQKKIEEACQLFGFSPSGEPDKYILDHRSPEPAESAWQLINYLEKEEIVGYLDHVWLHNNKKVTDVLTGV